VAHEDDVERAVPAGPTILQAISELNESDPELGLQERARGRIGLRLMAPASSPLRIRDL
jgi:hypothetical protein